MIKLIVKIVVMNVIIVKIYFCKKSIMECYDCKLKYCLKCGKNFGENNICNLCKNIYSQGKAFCNSIHTSINAFFNIENSLETNNKMSQNLNFFYQSTLIFFSELLESLEKYNLIIIQPLEDYKQNLNQFNESILSDFNFLLKKYNNSKEKLIKTQRRFYASKQ